MSTPKHPKRPADLNQRAHQVFLEAVSEPLSILPSIQTTDPKKLPDRVKDPAAVALGMKGGLMRAASLSPQQRSEAARKAASARWAKKKQ